MFSLDQHLAESAAQIRSDAKQYAKSYGISYEQALREVRDEYVQGFCEAEEAMRNGDWDYGRE